MLSPNDEYDWLLLILTLLVLVGDLEDGDVDSAIRGPHRLKPDELII